MSDTRELIRQFKNSTKKKKFNPGNLISTSGISRKYKDNVAEEIIRQKEKKKRKFSRQKELLD